MGRGSRSTVRRGHPDELFPGPFPEGIDARGTRSIRIRFRWRGKRYAETIPLPPTRRNVQWAKQKLDAIRYEIAAGTFDYAKHFPESRHARADKSAGPTVRELLEQWLEGQRRSTAPSTWDDYRNMVYHHLIPALGYEYDDRGNRVRERLASEVTKGLIKSWIGSLDVSAKRINNLLIPLRGAFSDAAEDELIQRDPTARLRNLEKDTFSEPDPFTPEEVRKILDAAGPYRPLWQFAFATGLRTSELLALEARDVDFERGVVYVRRVMVKGIEREGSKTGELGVREVRLFPPAREALEAALARDHKPEDKVFLNPRKGVPYRSSKELEKQWLSRLKKAGVRIEHRVQPRNGRVRYRSQYQTRHTYASTLLSLGVHPMWVAAQMGHVDWGMIRKVYGRWIPDVDRDVASAAERKLGPIWTQGEPKKLNPNWTHEGAISGN